MSTVAILCAMPMELRPITKRLRLRRGDGHGTTTRCGTVGAHEVVAIVTGMGTALATAATEALLRQVTPAHVVVVGITGAVDDETPIGTLVRPAVVTNAATGTEHRPVTLRGEPRGVMWTTDRITQPEELPVLRARGVVALDMETAAIAACCEARDIPWSVIRAVSDRATDGSVDDAVFRLSHQDGSPDPGAVLRYVARHPGRVPGLVRLARGSTHAAQRAAADAIEAIAALRPQR